MTTSRSPWFISALLLLLPSAAAGQPKCTPVPAGLTLRYSFDEPNFQKASAPSVAGLVGKALSFDGIRQFAEQPSSVALNFGERDFSIELWVRTTFSQGTRNFVDKRDARPRGYALFVERGSFGFQVAGGEQQTSVVADRAHMSADGQWHHVAAVAKRLPPAAPALYVDGVLRANSGRLMPLESIDNDIPLWLGRHHRNSFVPRDEIYFTGAIDELAFYRRALSAAEVKAIHAAGKAGKCR